MAITSVGQEYKSIKERQDYSMGIGMIFRGRGISMDIRKTKDNFDKDKKPKCFNYNIYRHMAKYC